MNKTSTKLAAVSGTCFFIAAIQLFFWMGLIALIIKYFWYIVVSLILIPCAIIFDSWLKIKFENRRQEKRLNEIREQVEEEWKDKTLLEKIVGD